eukprot:5839091-Prorocentrum_lima.AAC.1
MPVPVLLVSCCFHSACACPVTAPLLSLCHCMARAVASLVALVCALAVLVPVTRPAPGCRA